MLRFRALLALLLAITWCSAAWHIDLEAVGLMFEHRHHALDHDAEHAPAGAPHDDHEEVFARDMAKDQVRIGAAPLWLALLGAALLLARFGQCRQAAASLRWRPEPPLAHVWQFVQRCAPESAAPPALA